MKCLINNVKMPFTKIFLSLKQWFRGVAQVASALAWGARGRPFKSGRPDQKSLVWPAKPPRLQSGDAWPPEGIHDQGTVFFVPRSCK